MEINENKNNYFSDVNYFERNKLYLFLFILYLILFFIINLFIKKYFLNSEILHFMRIVIDISYYFLIYKYRLNIFSDDNVFI